MLWIALIGFAVITWLCFAVYAGSCLIRHHWETTSFRSFVEIRRCKYCNLTQRRDVSAGEPWRPI